jgi:hypothetical protein
VTSIRDRSFPLDSPGQSMSWKEQVFLMFCTLSVCFESGCERAWCGIRKFENIKYQHHSLILSLSVCPYVSLVWYKSWSETNKSVFTAGPTLKIQKSNQMLFVTCSEYNRCRTYSEMSTNQQCSFK